MRYRLLDQKLTPLNLAKIIDHTLLKHGATTEDIGNLCKEAKKYQFHSVCVPPCFVSLAYGLLKRSSVKVTTVIGFPMGYNTSHMKKMEAKNAIARGAVELDIVMNIGIFKEKNDTYIKNEIEEILKILKKTVCKIIIEASLLKDCEKERAAQLIIEAGGDFVKTSTGFFDSGASISDIHLLKKTVQNKIKIKAAGGIKDFKTANKMVLAGADRIGSSNSVIIYKECLETVL